MTPINDFVKNYAHGTNCERFAVTGPRPFNERDLFCTGKKKMTQTEARMAEWLTIFMHRLGKKHTWLQDVPRIAMLKFWRDYQLKGKHKTPPLQDVYLIIEAKTYGSAYYWQTRIQGKAFTLNYGLGDRIEERFEGFDNIVKSMLRYVCKKIGEGVDSLYIEKFTAYVADAQVSPKNAGAKWSSRFVDLPVRQEIFDPGVLAAEQALVRASMIG